MKYFVFSFVAGVLAAVVFSWLQTYGKFYQPQDALLIHAPTYEVVFDIYADCAAVDCDQSTYDRLIEEREEALQADWSVLLTALMDKGNWRKNPYSDLTGPWAVRDGFWQMVENLGGVEYVRSNCVPYVGWTANSNTRSYSHTFYGLRCGEEIHYL